MMVNTVPSYCVSLDILMSECSFPSAVSPDTTRPSSPIEKKKSTRMHAKKATRTESELSVQIEELISEKEVTGHLVQNIRRSGLSDVPPHPQRWLVLSIFCCVSFMQVVVWNTWSPIAAAALYAFPSWTSGTVALFSNWGSLCSVLFIIPTCWMLNEKGLKFGCIIGSSLCTIGSGLRCLTMNELWFTLCAHMGAFMNAVAGVIFGPSVVLLSSLWFPANQRASATGAGTAVSALGMAGSYLIGPTIISLPVPDYQMSSERDKLKQEIQMLMYLDFIMHFVLLWFIVWLFPATPPIPPTASSSVSLSYKRDFRKSIIKLIKNGNIWLLGGSAALASGMTSPWLSQMTILFTHKDFTPTESAKLGFWTIISSCFFSVTATRFSDLFQGHIKAILLGLLAFATVMFIWIYDIVDSTSLHKHFLIIAVISGFSATWASSPLYYELGAEIAYPVPEGMVAGYIMSMSSLSCVFVYGLFYLLSETRLLWLNYGLVAYNIGALLVLFLVDEQYNRLVIDNVS